MLLGGQYGSCVFATRTWFLDLTGLLCIRLFPAGSWVPHRSGRGSPGCPSPSHHSGHGRGGRRDRRGLRRSAVGDQCAVQSGESFTSVAEAIRASQSARQAVGDSIHIESSVHVAGLERAVGQPARRCRVRRQPGHLMPPTATRCVAPYSMERLLRFLMALGCDIDIVIRPSPASLSQDQFANSTGPLHELDHAVEFGSM